MAVKLHRAGFDHAKRLAQEGKVVLDERDDWHGMSEYGKWHLGIDDEEDEDTKGRYKFPYGDFKKVHRCAILAAESRAGQYKFRHRECGPAPARDDGGGQACEDPSLMRSAPPSRKWILRSTRQ